MTAKAQPQKRQSIDLEAIDSDGRRGKLRLHARVIGPTKVKKQAPRYDSAKVDDSANDGAAVDAELDNAPTSKATEAEREIGRRTLCPPVSLTHLAYQAEESTELGQCVRTMVTNTVGFGWQLREIILSDTDRQRLENEASAERDYLRAQLTTVHPVLSLTALREKVQTDKHLTGNGYLELIDSVKGELVGLNHIPGHSVRIAPKDKRPTKVMVPRVRPDRNYAIEEVPMYYRFRKFAQMRNNKVVWFKEAGDPRTMDCETGKTYKDPKAIPFKQRATSLIHFSIYSPLYAYGLPLWFGNTLSIKGSRAAEEINFQTMNSNAVPSFFLIVENGVLTEGSIQRLTEWVEEHIQGQQNYSTFLLLEGEAMEEGSPNPANFRIRVEPMSRVQTHDELFQEYDQNNRDKVRQAFRLPPIFVGRADDYTRATADTSRDIADEQVFAPERTRDDELINRFVLSRWGARFHAFRSNTPNITDDIELIRLMGIAEKSGGMTPRRADRIVRDVFGDAIGPMPVGIDLDRPFSITFAEAQKTGGVDVDDDEGNAPATKVLKSLLDLRTQVEKELDSRLDDLTTDE